MPATVVQAKCPRCQKMLRIPADWVGMSMRCKHCKQPVQARTRPKTPLPAPVTDPIPAVPVAPVAAAVPLPVPMPAAPLPATPAPQYAYPAPPAPPQYAAPQYAPQPGPFAAPSGPIPAQPVAGYPAQPAYPSGPTPALSGPAGGLAFGGPMDARQAAPRAGRKKKSGTPFLAIGLGLFLLTALGGGAFAAWYFLGKPSGEVTVNTQKEDDSNAVAGPGIFPRRLMVISVNNYLYANSLNFGADPEGDPKPLKHSVANFTESLAGQLRVPKDQTYLLTDGLPGSASRAPLKGVIEQGVTRFLDASRAQDRVLLVFTGHAVELDGEAFIVPLEGDLKDKKSLVPLAWLYDKLAGCKAQQKSLIMDVCRYDPARGAERADGGDMSPKLAEALANPPAGVQVWSSCAAGQRSLETDYDAARDNELKMDVYVRGSVFLNLFFYASQKGNKAGIQHQKQPINLNAYADALNDYTRRFAKTFRKMEQTPKLAGTASTTSVPYNPDEPPAPTVQLPTAAEIMGGGLADKGKIRALVAEITVPTLKVGRKADATLALEEVLPFPAAAMAKYEADYKSLDEVKKETEKYPLRVAVIEAMELLNSIRPKGPAKEGEIQDLFEELRSSATDAVKKDVFKTQLGPAKIKAKLDESLAKLEGLADMREEEMSPRWQAHYDYITAMTKLRIAYMYEYGLMLGKIRKDDLPELDANAGHTGWRLASQEKPQSKEAKELADDARKLLNKVIKDHPNTPWEVLSKRERMTAPGLKWEPFNFAS